MNKEFDDYIVEEIQPKTQEINLRPVCSKRVKILARIKIIHILFEKESIYHFTQGSLDPFPL
jgi:hypothetical protein